MQFEFSNNSLDKISSDVILLFVFQTGKGDAIKLTNEAKNIDSLLGGKLLKSMEIASFSGKRGEMFSYFPQDKILSPWVIVLGLGKEQEFIADDLRRVAGIFAKTKGKQVKSIALCLPESLLSESVSARMFNEGLMLGLYDFNKYKTKKKKQEKLLNLVIFSKVKDAKIQNELEIAKLYAQATILARDLVNEQAAVATPTYLSDLALEIAKQDPNISCKVFGRKEAAKLGMEAFLGIARASEEEPKFIHLEYKPQKSAKKKLALVGKGITFDSGGINVKPGDSMIDMKMDMSGAAIVLGVFSVISQIKPDFPVMGLIAATPNLISSRSLVPGDVVKALNGKTIEILNTDAEGRVTMADSLSYAVKEGATEIIDFATLTGACMVALGTEISGLFANNQDFAQKIKTAAFSAGEKVWELPLEKEYASLNKSEVADIANIPNTRYGGTITAALFLQEFIGDVMWAHLDIAGPAFSGKGTDVSIKGGTGHGVRTVLNLLV
jgi:leucyl aminopeptidase